MKATLGSVRDSSCTSSASSPTSATSTMRAPCCTSITTPCWPSAPKRIGSPCRSGMSMSSRTVLAVTPSKACVVEHVAVLEHLDEGGALVLMGPPEGLEHVGPVHVVGASDEARLGADGQRQRVERMVEAPEGRGLGDLPQLARGRVLPLGEPVDLVVEEQDRDVDVAAQGMDEVVAADRQRVAVTGDDPHVQVGASHGQARGDGRRAPVDRVHPVGVHVVREAGCAADARHEGHVLAANAELGHEQLDGGEDRVVAAARAPADLLVAHPVLAGGHRDQVGHDAASEDVEDGRLELAGGEGHAAHLGDGRGVDEELRPHESRELPEVHLGDEHPGVAPQHLAEVARERAEVREVGLGDLAARRRTLG